ncbi:MAG: alpha/beta fold hydrolase [Candidatus Limnocylindria bacterium]
MNSAPVERRAGPPLLLFHGWNGSSQNFGAWLPALEPHFSVLTPDLPGCAGVAPLASRHTALAYATWALDLLGARGLDRVAVGGLCSGTAIALAFADIAPERVAALLLHTPFLRRELIRPLIRAQLALLVSPAGALWGPIRRSTTLSMLHRRLFAEAAQVDAEHLAHDQADLLLADPRAGRELARDLLTIDRMSTVRAWKGPLGVILADHDAFVDTPSTVVALADAAPQTLVERFPGGHGWTPAYREHQSAALARLAPQLRAAMV